MARHNTHWHCSTARNRIAGHPHTCTPLHESIVLSGLCLRIAVARRCNRYPGGNTDQRSTSIAGAQYPHNYRFQNICCCTIRLRSCTAARCSPSVFRRRAPLASGKHNTRLLSSNQQMKVVDSSRAYSHYSCHKHNNPQANHYYK